MKVICSFCKQEFNTKGEGIIRFWRDKRFNICYTCKKKADEYLYKK